VDTVAVFIHGFLGGAASTWEHFPFVMDVCLDKYPWWETTDAFFLDYDGSHEKPIAVHSENCQRFLGSIFPLPNEKIFRPSFAPLEGLREKGFTYKKLILVGHSEGAVIIRRFLVSHYKRVRDSRPQELLTKLGRGAAQTSEFAAATKNFLVANPVLDATLVLFAPALHGASLTGWPGLFLGYLRTVKLLTPLIDTLTGYDELKKGSPVLAQLQRDTESFASEASYCKAFRGQSYFGDKDKIVYISEYSSDPAAIIVPGQTHGSVCKPNLNYREPVSYVRYDQGRSRSAT